MAVNYYNVNGEQLAIVHFPGSGLESGSQIVEDNIDRKIMISNNLTVISIINKQCWENSPIVQQADKNNFPILNTALDEMEWSNLLKINHIIQCLNMVNTEYALILDGRDTIITNDLDDLFLARFMDYHTPILFNATPFPHPNIVIEPLNELISIKGKSKYLNAGVCIGKTKFLKLFYAKALEIKHKEFNNIKNSEQLIIRKTKHILPNMVKIDSENKLFRIVHQADSKIEKILTGKRII